MTEPSSSDTAARKRQLCKEIRVEKSKLTHALKKGDLHRFEPHIPAGLKLAEHLKPESADVSKSGARKKGKPREMLESMTVTTVSTEYPYSAVGVLFVGPGSSSTPTSRGTAAVLAASNMIVTAASTIPFRVGENWWGFFVPAYHDGNEPFGSANVIYRYGYTDAVPTANDNFVVLRLDSPIGDQCGGLGYWWTTDSDAYLAYQDWNTVGYSAEAPIAVLGLPIERDNLSGTDLKAFDAYEVFDTRSDPGWYGAPMYGNVGGAGPYAIAVLGGNYYNDEDEVNYMNYVGGETLGSIINWGLAHFE